MQARRPYPSDLTDQQWEAIKDLIPPARSVGRRRTTCAREVINAVFYVTRSGCAWRYLPKEFPPWQTIYDYFSRWNAQGIWKQIHVYLAKQTRVADDRLETPTTLIIDAQSVRAQYGEERGWDGFKKVRGRKRQIVVDTLGIVWGVKVHAANQGENRRGFEAIEQCPQEVVPHRILGDYSYSKIPFDIKVFERWGIWPESRKGSKTHSFISNLKPQRWIVERSFAWLNNYRRLSRDYEKCVRNSEIFIYISQLQMLLNRLLPAQ
jgi:putative transposase